MEIIWLIVGVVLGGVALWFMAKSKFQDTGSQYTEEVLEMKTALRLASEHKAMLEKELSEVKPEILAERQKVLELSNQLTRKETEYASLEKRLKEQKEELEKLNERFATEFKNLANEIFEEKSKKFTDQNKNNLVELLSPLKERISEFQKKVEDSNKEDAARNASLIQQIKNLGDLNKQITKEAENLTKALKGDTKTQGNWGEVILERILERSGLEKEREYETQVSEVAEDGRRYQPDVVIKLPDDKKIIIDSKVSLIAYERFANTEDEGANHLKTHITSVRTHVKLLGEKYYQNLFGVDGLDFVLLFIPIEPAFTLAVKQDPELFNDAYARNVVIVSPTTLIATLRTIASIWKQEYRNRNVHEIARQSGALYDKFVAFTEDLVGVGKYIDQTQRVYRESMKKLSEGKGNLVKRVENIKKLGAKADKQLDQRLLDRSISEGIDEG